MPDSGLKCFCFFEGSFNLSPLRLFQSPSETFYLVDYEAVWVWYLNVSSAVTT